MVAVALSAEVRPLPMPMEPEQAAAAQVGGTTPGTSTGVESVDDHIARLKANARQHVDREMLAAGSEASPRGAKTPYLPSKEVAKTIKCRFFPNCYYADKCMFFHPSSLENAIPYTAAAPTSDHVNGIASSNGPSSMNGHSNGYAAASPSQLNGEIPLSPNGASHAGGEEYGNGFDMAYKAQQPQNGQQGYYIPTGYENQGEYNPYASQMFPPQHQQHSHSQSNGQQQQASNSQANQYYGFVPYGPHSGYAYPTGQPQYPYYPQQNGGYPMYMPQAMQSHEEQSSPINGVVSPSSSSTAIPDPAIVAQGPESQDTAAPATNGAEASTSGSASMEKSSSAQSGKSTTSSKSKKAKKSAEQASTNGVNGASSSPVEGLAEALTPNGEFVPMPYYPVGVPMNLSGMPSEMMMMPPLPHMLQHQQGGPHFQPQAYGSFGSPMNGQTAQLEADFSNKASISGDKNEKKQINGSHERTPSSSAPNGQMHTFFQTSGEGAPYAARGAPAAVNGARTAPTSASTIGGATTARFNPASSTNGPKRFPPSSYATNGVLLPRSGPVNGPNSIRRIPYDSNKPTLPCRYFETRSCRHGDLCHYTHLLIEERVIPNHPEGKLTRDARLLSLNIGSPDGRISDVLPRNPTDFNSSNGPSRRPPVLNGAQQPQNGQQQNAPNGFGMPQVNAKGRFVHPQQPNTQAFAAQQQHVQQPPQQQQQAQQQQQQQKEQQIVALVNNNSADAQEKIQRLISETRNLPSSMPPPASNAAGPRPNGTAPRANGIPPTLGRRPPPPNNNNNRNGVPNHQTNSTASHTTRQQRVPSGENDFPALASSSSPSVASNVNGRTTSMERSSSASSSAEKKVDSAAAKVATSTAPATSTPAAPAEAKTEEAPKSQSPATSTATASTPSASPASAPAPTPAAAPAKPVTFSWASAAAKAASLPTPPPKRPVSKARLSSNKEKEGKGEKGSKAEKGSKDAAGKKDAKNEDKNDAKQAAAAAPTPAASASTPAATSTSVSAPAPVEPAVSAAQAVTSESVAAPALKA